MKPVFLITLLLATTFCSSAYATHTDPPVRNESSAEIGESARFLKNWSPDNPAYIKQMRCTAFYSERNWAVTTQFIQSLLERDRLSPQAKFSYTVNADSVIPTYKMDKSSGTLADQFYCEQAIWEAAPLPKFWGGGSVTLQANQSFQANTANKQYEADRVFLHIIPSSINAYFRYPETFTDAELHNVHNLALMSVTEVKGAKLREFRSEWVKFISNGGVTRQKTLDFAADLLKRYSEILKLAG